MPTGQETTLQKASPFQYFFQNFLAYLLPKQFFARGKAPMIMAPIWCLLGVGAVVMGYNRTQRNTE